ncbi:MAG: TRAP transporter small permease subunit [Alphaproteobacteria bacterium]|nr:TRAP transporter small permease subunit [Alphaproteobacteria bacterium]
MNDRIGRLVSWLTLATVLICGTVVVLRYAAGSGYVWMQELYVWTHALVFMLASGFAFLRNAHVRVDIFYAGASERSKAWIDLLGVVFLLLPWLGLIGWAGWSYVAYSWAIWEESVQNNGMPGVFILKSAILGFAVLLALQGLAWIGRCILVIRGQQPPPAEGVSGPMG